MKKSILILCGVLAILQGCSNPSGDDDSSDLSKTEGKTYVRFSNSNDFIVSVYTDASRLSKLLDVAANSTSGLTEIAPNAFAIFYFTCRIMIDDIEFPYEFSGLSARIDAEKTTDIRAPLLTELDSSESAKPITTAVYLKIQNAGSSSLVLRRGSYEEIPQGMVSSLVNGGETAAYTVNAGPASNYSVYRNSVTPVSFPAGLSDFLAGRLYSLKFDGTSLTLLADKPVTVAQVLQITAPENIRATSLANGYISVVWEKAGTETSYGIYRSESSTGNYVKIGTASATSYTDTTVTLSNTYYYRISAIKGSVESEKSAAVVSAQSEVVSLPAPEGLNVYGQTANSLSLSWTPVPEAASYTIYRGSGPDNVHNTVAAVSSTSYTITGLMPATTYYFAVSSVNAGDESLPSAVVQGTTTSGASGGGGDGTIPLPPPRPTGLVVTGPASGNISLSWNSAANADSYDIYRGNSLSGASGKIGSTGGTSYADYTVAAGAAYYYSVRAVNASGNSPDSERAFAYAAPHSQLQSYSGSYTTSISAGQKHYYRFSVSAGQGYTITWENGSGGNADYYVRCSAWQNDGTALFTNSYEGYTSPKVFTASTGGYVTVEIRNANSSTGYTYKVYY